MASNQAVAVFQAVALTSETTYGVAVDPSGANFFHVADGSVLNATRTNAAIPDKTGTSRSRQGAIPGFPMADGVFNVITRTSGVAGTVPNIDGLLQNTFFTDSVDNGADSVQASPSPSTTSYKIGTASNITAGTIAVVTSANFTEVNTAEARYVTNNAAGVITVTPAMSAAPASTDVVSATNTYKLQAARDGSLTFWSYVDSGDKVSMLSKAMPGFVPNTLGITWEHGGEGYLSMSFTGEGSGEYIFTGRTTLGAAIADASVTTITLSELGVVSVGSRILVEAEAMKVLSKSADTGSGTVTVERDYDGTTADAHADALPVRPYRVTPSLTSQTPLPSIYCDVFVGSGSTQFPATRVSITLNDNITILRDSSSTEGQGTDYSAGMRTIEVEIEGFLRDSSQVDAFLGNMGLGTNVLIQWGRTAGKIVCVNMPNCVMQGTPIPADGDGPVTITLQGEARLSAADEDEFVLAFG